MMISDFVDFINSQTDITQPIELRDTKVLIDGHHIQHELYFEASRQHRDDNYGTNYAHFADTITSFVRRLQICQVVPIIIYNGSIDPTKYDNAFNDRIKEIQNLVKDDYRCRRLQSPTLCNYVFTSVLRNLNIEIIQSCSQPWIQMASLADKLKCPLVSNKKCFYFMDNDIAVISKLPIKRRQLSFSTSRKLWFLKCKAYHSSSLQKRYKGFRKELLPLIGVLLERRLLDFNGIDGMRNEIFRNCNHKIDVLMEWITTKSFDKVLESVLKFISQNKKSINSCDLKKLMTCYQTNEFSGCSLESHLMDPQLKCNTLKVKTAEEDVDIILPDWFVYEYHKGVIRPALMNVIQMKTHVLYPQLEDFSQPSSFDCTLSLRKFLYGLLRTDTKIMSQIKVMTRKDLNRFDHLVSPQLKISELQELPVLANIRKLAIHKRRALLLSILRVTEGLINRIKVSLMVFDLCQDVSSIDSTTLIIILLIYWRIHNKESNWKTFIGSIILSIIYYLNEDLSNEECWTQLCIPPKSSQQFNVQFVHNFSQFQSCFHMFHFINTILENPIREGNPYFCLNGIFIYNTSKQLSNDDNYKAFVCQLFKNYPLMANIYNEIIQLVVFDINGNAVNDINQNYLISN
ncbi:protein asteroid homolog 1-like [Oppia nitens]|uniref:protein asteroid homolog 1-like n=1 Tax=Oppia nitens TaxID=1686743 RepID=UPI0023DCBB2C|nr:protein asteroid homolog 1-like [Oppia nitens]